MKIAIGLDFRTVIGANCQTGRLADVTESVVPGYHVPPRPQTPTERWLRITLVPLAPEVERLVTRWGAEPAGARLARVLWLLGGEERRDVLLNSLNDLLNPLVVQALLRAGDSHGGIDASSAGRARNAHRHCSQ